jgi:hypothetical protein
VVQEIILEEGTHGHEGMLLDPVENPVVEDQVEDHLDQVEDYHDHEEMHPDPTMEDQAVEDQVVEDQAM